MHVKFVQLTLDVVKLGFGSLVVSEFQYCVFDIWIILEILVGNTTMNVPGYYFAKIIARIV